ncbi:MAG: DUF2461 domain-containing protein, partial [Hyphomicrobiales bacterium]|nr:DUF2461 domain-containing protein [Hyphomicrobiales bacterium]
PRRSNTTRSPAMAAPKSAPLAFDGFPRDLVDFLRELRANNDKAWFEAHRNDYQALLVAPAQSFIAAVAEPLAALYPPLQADPKTNRSLRRIHRDTRFSADKRPFHDHLHVIFWHGEKPNHGPGVHFVIGPDSFGFGAGQWGFEGDTLARYRTALADAAAAAALAEAIATAERDGDTTLDPPALAKLPRGFSAPEPYAGLLRHKCVITRSDEPHPNWLFDGRLIESLTPRIAALMPLIGWLSRHLG